MKVDFYEKLFLWLTAVTLVVFLGAIATALLAAGSLVLALFAIRRLARLLS